MDLRIDTGRLKGAVNAPASKSMAHRALFCAAFADGETLIQGAGESEDILATLNAVEALGAVYRNNGGDILVRPVSLCGREERTKYELRMKMEGMPPGVHRFDCGESGTTLRFALPLLGLNGETGEIKMHGRLGVRPLRELIRELSHNGMAFDQSGHMICTQGKLRCGTYRLPGNVSSQYISALLTALPLADGPSRIEIEGPVSSAAYVNMTLEMVKLFGAEITREDHTFIIKPAGVYHSPGTVQIEGDWSSAAFWMTANALGSDVSVEGLKTDSIQPDREVNAILPRILAGGSVIDVDACPDLLPVLSVAAAVSPGTTTFAGAARLRAKESDRLEGAASVINALGGKAEAAGDQLIVEGTGKAGEIGTLRGGTVSACGDHRLAMSAAIAATVCEGPVNILGAETAAKSYPEFWNDYRALGGSAEES